MTGFCLIFIFHKTKGFQLGNLLKMPPSSPPFMKEFGLGNLKYKQKQKTKAKTNFAELMISRIHCNKFF